MDRYDISYMLITQRALARRNITLIKYLTDACFVKVFGNDGATVYKPLCRVES